MKKELSAHPLMQQKKEAEFNAKKTDLKVAEDALKALPKMKASA